MPAKYSLLSARAIPSSGGNTEFADMRAAYDALDGATKAEVEDLIAACWALRISRRTRRPPSPVRQILVRTHPVTGRKSLFLASHAGTIIAWPMPEARAFLRDLIEHATQPRFVHAHQWRHHDLVVWDSRQTMHRARRYRETEEVRDLRRTTIAGDGPTVAQAETGAARAAAM